VAGACRLLILIVVTVALQPNFIFYSYVYNPDAQHDVIVIHAAYLHVVLNLCQPQVVVETDVGGIITSSIDDIMVPLSCRQLHKPYQSNNQMLDKFLPYAVCACAEMCTMLVLTW